MDSINLAKCNNCVKRDVCSIKEEINEIINSIEDLLAKETTSKDIDFSLRCKHFLEILREKDEIKFVKVGKKHEGEY